MEKLILSTTAYSVFDNDISHDTISHAYLLHFNDVYNLRAALMIFARRFFGISAGGAEEGRLMRGALTDCRIYPEEGKKPTVEGVSAIIADSALRPIEKDKKLYIFCNFNEFSALAQNKLLKTLEEPPAGVYFLLGATSLTPVLDTVRSRVKTLVIPPFSEEEIYGALVRGGENPLNGRAARECGGILGAAQAQVKGEFADLEQAAREICLADDVSGAAAAAAKYGDVKNKNELITRMQGLYFQALRERALALPLGEVARKLNAAALSYAVQSCAKAAMDVKFNAYFQGLLYDFMLRVMEENNKWSKLRV